ncbi:MAG: ABC transporter ATP-binding protein [Syntrophomonadaceae bacterium]|nr:ABC transporter ATP-binding protein [Syntrophomonadaceae bacterium]
MDYAIESQNLTRVFGNFTAVDRLTINIHPGEVCGFLGANGAGKSTAIRMLCGILQPSSGTARVLGYDLLREVEQIKSQIGYMSQKFSLYEDLRVKDNLAFYAGIYSIPYHQRAGRIAGMLKLADITNQGNTLVANLSVGWKQRLALACAIISRPALVFLDEPTSGVSPISRREFFNIIQNLSNQGTTVIVTTHFMDEAERCDRIAFMSEGRLLALDTPDNLKKHVIQGQMVELELPHPLEYIKSIGSLPYVRECSIHGAFIHVLLGRQSDLAALQDFTGVLPRPILPTLEDVFITLAKKKPKGAKEA